MMSPRQFFHYVSYLQYPVMLVAVVFAFRPYIVGFDTIWVNYNNMLIAAALGISLSTLQDTTRTQNELSRKIWEHPRKGRIAIIVISAMTLMSIVFGLIGLYVSPNDALHQMSLGMLALGIGLVGLLKGAIEMFENHRIDRKTHQSPARGVKLRK
jgi:hypothetical protein